MFTINHRIQAVARDASHCIESGPWNEFSGSSILNPAFLIPTSLKRNSFV